MSRKKATYSHLDQLKSEYEGRKEDIRKRLADFASVRPEEYFYELVYCLLTPQSSAVNAARAVEALRAAGILANDIAPAPLLHQKRFYIRFHNTKARHIVKAKAMFPEILARLMGSFSSADLRMWLVQNVAGLGWKEASHFLRNIGHRNLAILDRHILKNLKRHNVLKRLPKSLSPRKYLSIEAQFATFSEVVGIRIDELDLLFWSRETGEILK